MVVSGSEFSKLLTCTVDSIHLEYISTPAKDRNLKLPRGYTKSFDITKQFLDKQLS